MLQLLRLIAIFAVIVIINNSTIVRSARFCGFSSKVSTCPGVDKLQIIFPFWIENRTADDKGECISYPGFQIKCAANGRPVINISNNLYYVLNLYNYHTEDGFLTVSDVVIDAQECPRPRRNISIKPMRFLEMTNNKNMTIFYNCSSRLKATVQHIPCLENYYDNTTGRSFAFLDEEIASHQYDWYKNCEEAIVVPVDSDNYDNPTEMNYTRALKKGFSLFWSFPVSCGNCELSGGKCWANETDQAITSPFHCKCPDGRTLVNEPCSSQVHSQVHSQSISPGPSQYSDGGDQDGISNVSNTIIEIAILVGVGVAVVVLLILLFSYRRNCYSLYDSTASIRRKITSSCYSLYKTTASSCYSLSDTAASYCRKIIKGPTNAELFISNNYGGLSLQKYTYSDIKKMTNSFEETLGQAGYGSVFKGKLHDGRLVAVKVLNESKGKGEDFINEVATIGRTNHVNVVSLLGFCIAGKKQALVYEFMPNGSLEKFIYIAKDSSTTSSLLGWEKLYQIALGIARGLEYLHRGCILHFDIKPHNILLDQDFRPKISGFGLAKLCPTAESLVSIVGARGTPGYIAPEVYCGNFGGVSHKSDVYSYGMMVLEIIGGRKNIDVLVENASQIYFPQWIYKRLRENYKVEESEEIEVTDLAGGVLKEKTARKMIMVALWCIQAHPEDRPSMTKVVDMLEGNTEDLQFPPNPFPGPSTSLP